ncbi:TPA: hypothetical protein ACH3X1_005750 [Trebouxia sp. C0004]
MAQTSAQLVPLDAGTQFSSARYVDWPQVQGFLDMAESALRAKNTANDILLKEKAIVLQHMSHQSEQSIQEVRHGQAEDTTFLRQQLEALLRERAAAKERIAGLERENSFLLDERDILFRQLELEAGKVETDRSFRTLMSARRSEEDMSALMHAALHPQQHAWEPMTPQEAAEGTRLFPSQAWLLSHTTSAPSLCCVTKNGVTYLHTSHDTACNEQSCCAHLLLFYTTHQYADIVQCLRTIDAYLLWA